MGKDKGKGKIYALDWVRALSCMGIVTMHIMKNINYDLPDYYFFNTIIPSFTDLVYLFMAVSSFGLCCGYYQRFWDGKIDWETFYKRRLSKILPFFIAMILLDLCMGFSIDSLMEGLVESTLFHGFIHHEFTVIGVGWFLGLVFIFYLSFPFFCVLLKNKKRAWFAFLIALGLNLICRYHLDVKRSNFAYSFCFFFAGGMIFLYKDAIKRRPWWNFIIVIIPAAILFYLKTGTITVCLLTAALLAFAVSLDIPSVRPIAFISSISMEIYLCHMAAFRVLEKLHILDVLGSGTVQYFITCVLVFIGACVMSVVIKFVLDKLFQLVAKIMPAQA